MASTVITNRDRSPLSIDHLRAKAPTIFAEAPHDSRSDRYLFVSTEGILDALMSEGWHPVHAVVQRPRDEGKRDFARHMIRFAHPSQSAAVAARIAQGGGMIHDGSGPRSVELVLTNSHDGSSSIQMSAGVFRLACSNGLMVSEGEAASYRVQHTRKWRDEVIEGTYRVLAAAPQVLDTVGEMEARQLEEPERLLLAQHAATLRWGEDGPPVPVERLLAPRRRDDNGHDAWTTLNVLQEHVIRGGDSYAQRNDRGRIVAHRETRPITGIDQLGTVNRGLWEAVTQLTSTSRVDMAAQVFARLSPSERAQLAMQFA